MFDEFLDGIEELYDDVDSFFTDLTGDKGVLDVVKTAIGGGSSGNSAEYSDLEAVDYDVTDIPTGAMASLDEAIGESKAIESVDFNEIQRRWYQDIYRMATGEDNELQ